ncbi:MAG: hydrogenase expression/formation protein HypE [Deferribacteraceae bacterium]|jgi:hydrogenase expression/formation protein HypE|nr:hydrogenase expression/formation protein HypE [Deferribacteraceae bacterium]
MAEITLSAGGGGKAMARLINGVFLKYFKNSELREMRDAAYILTPEKTAFSTDSFIIKPEFFPGGNIGKLSVAGTTNDLACSGAVPLYLSCGMVIPEGYDTEKLEKIVSSMAEAAGEAEAEIVTGDTKVAPRGDLQGLIINVSGIGRTEAEWNNYSAVKAGDCVIISSDIARHGVSVLLAREELGFSGGIESDCNVLCKMLQTLYGLRVHFVRDATRGGVAAVLNEISERSGLGITVRENDIPLRDDVAHFCDALGFDPLAVANEGAVIIITEKDDAEAALERVRKHPAGRNAAICGYVRQDAGVIMETSVGGRRYIEMPLGEILPRIC